MPLKAEVVKEVKLPETDAKGNVLLLTQMLKLASQSERRKVLESFACADEVGQFRKAQGDWLMQDCASDEELKRVQTQLRQVWKKKFPDTGFILREWLNWRPSSSRAVAPLVPVMQLGLIMPNPTILRCTLAFGVVETYSKLFECGNPDCPRPYRIAWKRKQRFCDRPQCAAVGQRAHKLAWWRKHGKQWRGRRRGKKSAHGKGTKSQRKEKKR